MAGTSGRFTRSSGFSRNTSFAPPLAPAAHPADRIVERDRCGSREAAGTKVLRATRTGAGFASDRGYGDGETASSEEALIGNQSRPQHCAESCWRFRCRCSWATVEGIEQVELTSGLRSLAGGTDRPGWR
jgi:hypothetical protein